MERGMAGDNVGQVIPEAIMALKTISATQGSPQAHDGSV